MSSIRSLFRSSNGRAHRVLLVLLAIVAVIAISGLALEDPVHARVAMLGGIALVLWLAEVAPSYVVTLGLLAGIPLALGGSGPQYRLGSVLSWAADPVLALFFGGFALGAAATRHGIDEIVAERALALSHHRRLRLLALVMGATALLSMWMSNIAAAAMMLAALRPHLHRGERTEPFRRALLLGVAMAANLGGMATPIGTGPNAIAIASLAPLTRVTFLQWMAFALPLTFGMLGLGFFLIARTHRVSGDFQPVELRAAPLRGRSAGLVAVFALAVMLWLTEPLHGVPAAVVSLGVAAILFGGGWLDRDDLGRIDWPTLMLIAGGLVLGKLADHAGLVASVASGVRWEAVPQEIATTALVLLAALLGALVSNTASAALLIPLALGLGLAPSIAILIAIGTSLGVPFVISTPPNAMAYGEGGLSARDLVRIGLPLMLAGGLIVGLTGPAFLAWIGIPGR